MMYSTGTQRYFMTGPKGRINPRLMGRGWPSPAEHIAKGLTGLPISRFAPPPSSEILLLVSRSICKTWSKGCGGMRNRGGPDGGHGGDGGPSTVRHKHPCLRLKEDISSAGEGPVAQFHRQAHGRQAVCSVLRALRRGRRERKGGGLCGSFTPRTGRRLWATETNKPLAHTTQVCEGNELQAVPTSSLRELNSLRSADRVSPQPRRVCCSWKVQFVRAQENPSPKTPTFLCLPFPREVRQGSTSEGPRGPRGPRGQEIGRLFALYYTGCASSKPNSVYRASPPSQR